MLPQLGNHSLFAFFVHANENWINRWQVVESSQEDRNYSYFFLISFSHYSITRIQTYFVKKKTSRIFDSALRWSCSWYIPIIFSIKFQSETSTFLNLFLTKKLAIFRLFRTTRTARFRLFHRFLPKKMHLYFHPISQTFLVSRLMYARTAKLLFLD